MTENYSERIENALNDIQKIQTMFRQRYGEECLADKEIEEVLKIAKSEHEEIKRYRAIGTVEECREAREVKRKITEIVNRQLIAGKDNYKEVYNCFYEIAKVIQNHY